MLGLRAAADERTLAHQDVPRSEIILRTGDDRQYDTHRGHKAPGVLGAGGTPALTTIRQQFGDATVLRAARGDEQAGDSISHRSRRRPAE
jgi:hypothetical protein